MNLIDLTYILLVVAGAGFGAGTGSKMYGTGGAVLGGILGLAAGLLTAYALGFVLAAILSWQTGTRMFGERRKDVDDAEPVRRPNRR